MTRSNDYTTILKDAERAVKKAVTKALREQGIVRPGTYSREVVGAAGMILHDAAVVTSHNRGGYGS